MARRRIVGFGNLASVVSRYPSSTFVGRVIRFPLRAIPSEMVVRIPWGPLRGARWRIGSSSHGCWLGTYEFEKQLYILKRLRTGGVMYDIGANVGFYTVLGAKAVGATGAVYAVEPAPRNLAELQLHIERNAIENATVLRAALADYSGISQFDEGSDPSMGHLAESTNTGLLVPVLTLDELVFSRGWMPPELIKLDVEGAEAAVIRGGTEVVRRHRPTWIVALHGPEQKTQCVSILNGLGYRLSTLTGERLSSSAATDEIPDDIVAETGY